MNDPAVFLSSLQWQGRALAIWAGWGYDLGKALLGMAALAAALCSLTRAGRSRLEISLAQGFLSPAWRLRLFLAGGLVLLALKTAQYLSLQGIGDVAAFLGVIWNSFGEDLMPNPALGLACHLEDHFEPILLIYAPAAWLTRSPLAVMLLHAALIWSSVLILWRWSGRLKAPALARELLCLLLAVSPYFHNGLSAWLYPAPLALPIGLLALWAWDERRWWAFLAAILVFQGVKEEGSVALACLGAAACLLPGRRREGAALLLGSLAAFGGITWLMGQFGDWRAYQKWDIFGWGAAPGEVFSHLLRRPWTPLAQWAWPPSRFLPFLGMLGSACFLPLACPAAILTLLLLNFPHQAVAYMDFAFHFYGSHYGGFLLPFLFWGAGHGLAAAWDRFPRRRHLIAAAMLAAAGSGLLVSSDYVIFNRASGARLSAAWTLIRMVHPEDSVWTEQAFAPALAFRERMKVLTHSFMSRPLQQGYFLPNVVLLDAVLLGELTPLTRSRLMSLLDREGYRLEAEKDGVFLWRRGGRTGPSPGRS
ncbi:MAG: DUF2079 domain-containing protein [Elusimicrobia bacterium]|nr:DUF2079 domain-containing protein [Elusimicrobiota bacterium]